MAMDKVLPRQIVRWKKIEVRAADLRMVRDSYRDFVQEMMVRERLPASAATGLRAPWMARADLSNQRGTSELDLLRHFRWKIMIA